MRRKRKFVFLFSAFLLTMCRAYSEPVSTIDGLNCRRYTDVNASKGFECSYTCPDGRTAGPFSYETDPSLSFTKGDLDRQFCGAAPEQFTPTEPAPSTSPTPAASPTLAESATVQVS